LKKNDFVYKKGNKPKGVYILYDGCIEIISKSKEGDKKEIYFVEPGELFGYRSLITEEVHNTSAKVFKNSKVCKLSKEDFFDLFVKDKKLALKFMKYLSEQLKRREKKLENRIGKK
jgi:CRP/FNR family transcriptional regulator